MVLGGILDMCSNMKALKLGIPFFWATIIRIEVYYETASKNTAPVGPATMYWSCTSFEGPHPLMIVTGQF